jgi:hypothetical protein
VAVRKTTRPSGALAPSKRKVARKSPDVVGADDPKGRIITFYSYKGGTGRSMALANVAWILASQGERVLTIDWDLEAPGLHRYFLPFISDRELTNTQGLIDFFDRFVEGARVHADASTTAWFESYAHLERFAFSLEWDFPGHGTVDLVCAGRQGPSYAASVTTFDWSDFYTRLGGGVFLEAVKRNLRAEYDYILVDSRTGISDTSGICTIQMPDELVVCFTLNVQSIVGAAATAESAFQQRMTRDRTPGIRVWPVPMRVELAERDRLERARDDVRLRFQKFLHRLQPDERRTYWGSVEVLYQPFFAYEETLAVLAERRQQTGSLLQSFEHLAGYLTDGKIRSLGEVSDSQRRLALSSYGDAQIGPFFISYSQADKEIASQVAAALRRHLGHESILWDQELLKAGDQWGQTLSAAMNRAQAILPLLSNSYIMSEHGSKEAAYALGRSLPIVPLLLPGNSWSTVASAGTPLDQLSKIYGFSFELDPAEMAQKAGDGEGHERDRFEHEILRLVSLLRRVSREPGSDTGEIDDEDPHRGQFGHRSERDGYRLSAIVRPLGDDWFDLEIQVTATDARKNIGEVEFHLHPTFQPSIRRVSSKRGVATLQLDAWGAFTVGAVVLQTLTQLELDLSEIPKAPKTFRER